VSKNLFESSIEKNESIEFFLGEGKYFSRNRETHEHACYAQVKGWVKRYIDEDPDKNILIFLKAFNNFIISERAKSKVFYVLESLLAIAVISNKNPNYFKTTPAKEISKTYDSIENYFSSNTFNTEELNDIIIYKERISELGCKTLSKKIST
jgi:hypothetical protein